MRQRTPQSSATGRLGSLLLAGSAAVCFGAPARAEPVQAFWLTPTILAGGAEDPDAPLAVQAKSKRSVVLPSSQVQLFDLSSADNGAAPTEAEPSFAQSDAGQAPVTVKLRGGFVDLEPSVNVKIAHLADATRFAGGLVPAQSAGFDAEIMNGRFSFSSDFIETADQIDRPELRDPQLRDEPQTIRLENSSRRHRFAAKVIDTENLRLLVDGEIGHVSDGFASSLRELPTGRLILPGSWSSVSSQLEFGSARLSVDYQDFVSNAESQRRQGVTLGYASSALSVYRKDASEFNLLQGGQWLKRTQFTGINADVIVADVLPDAVADAIDPIRPFLPTSIAGGFEHGDIARAPEYISGPRDRVRTANVAMTWDTALGETTASVWQRQVSTDVITPGEDKIPLSRSSDRFVDISHKIRRGNWQFGAGLSLIETSDTIAGDVRADRQVAPHISVAYAPENGPTIELRVGAADAQSQIIDDNVAARSKARQIQLSVDLSSFAQDELNKPDAKLKLEYRYDFSGGDRDPVTGHERGGGHALLLTFSTPLN